jgi:hypothetical protein
MHAKSPDRAAMRERLRKLKAEVERRTANTPSAGEDYLELRKLIRDLQQLRAELLSSRRRDQIDGSQNQE